MRHPRFAAWVRRVSNPAADGAAAARADNYYASKAPTGVSARKAANWILSAEIRSDDALDSIFGLVRSAYTELYAETRGAKVSNAILEAVRAVSDAILDAIEESALKAEGRDNGELARRMGHIGEWARKAHNLVVASD